MSHFQNPNHKQSSSNFRAVSHGISPIRRFELRDSIRRKPVPMSPTSSSKRRGRYRQSHDHQPSDVNNATYAEGTAGVSSTLPSTRRAKNPLEKQLITIIPDQLGQRAPKSADTMSYVPRTVIARPGRPTKRRTSIWRQIVDGWRSELLCCIVSVCCVIIILAILGTANGTPLLALPYEVPINAVIQFPITIAVFSLLLPLSSCISQWKWLWFLSAKKSNLSDFQKFDAGSRNIPGAVSLFLALKMASPAFFGALLVILAVAVAPITQFAVAYTDGLVVVATGSDIAAVKTLQVVGPGSGSLDVFTGAVNQGLKVWDQSGLDPNIPAISCPTGHCQFPQVSALSVCSSIQNITDHLVISEDTALLPSLQDDCSLEYDANRYSIVACKTPQSQTVSSAFSPRSAIIYSMPVIFSQPKIQAGANSTPPLFGALEAIFSLCANTYNVSVSNGSINAYLIESSTLQTTQDFAGVNVNCTVADGETASSPALCRIQPNLGAAVLEAETDGDGSRYVAAYSVLEELALAMNAAVSGRWSKLVTDDTEEEGINTDSDSTDAATQASLSNITTAPVATTQGTALSIQPVLTVSWAALSLLMFETAATILFLFFTMIVNAYRKSPVLKSSATAQLVALGESARQAVGGIDEAGMLDRKARVLDVVYEDRWLDDDITVDDDIFVIQEPEVIQRGRPRKTATFSEDEICVFPLSQAAYESQTITPSPAPVIQPIPDQGSRHTTASVRRQLSQWEYGDSLTAMDQQDMETIQGKGKTETR
ncbi:hypothetical protein Cpir12675_000225 [Ceratocystis pirilliformis]|uniref:Uncharacterized protein n=1 Tax=Ceratocystis pirilliformis TaxID=259994 RepID=A0ABR3ZLX9_9PEZI